MDAKNAFLECAETIRRNDEDDYLALLFEPASSRAGVTALLALVAEVERIHAMVSEPVTGHIRYAWWREAVQEIKAGKPARRHPVVLAVAEHLGAAQLLDALEHFINESEEAFTREKNRPQDHEEAAFLEHRAWLGALALLCPLTQHQQEHAAHAFAKAQCLPLLDHSCSGTNEMGQKTSAQLVENYVKDIIHYLERYDELPVDNESGIKTVRRCWLGFRLALMQSDMRFVQKQNDISALRRQPRKLAKLLRLMRLSMLGL